MQGDQIAKMVDKNCIFFKVIFRLFEAKNENSKRMVFQIYTLTNICKRLEISIYNMHRAALPKLKKMPFRKMQSATKVNIAQT